MSKEEVFENLERVASAIATQFSPLCEAVLHDLKRPEASITFVAGNVTGRQAGGPVTDLVLNLLAKSESPDDVVDYTSRTRDGRTLTSSTVFIRDADGHPIGVFCINFDVTSLLAASGCLQELVTPSTPLEVQKSFSTDVPDLLDSIIRESLRRELDGGDSDERFSKEKRQNLLADLDAQGVFRVQNSVPTLAGILGVSRYTIYKDLKDIREESVLSGVEG